MSTLTGRQLRDAGIQQAVDSANEEVDGWAEMAYGALLAYMKAHPDKTFMAEEVRNYAYKELDLPMPPHCRAWGGVIQRAAREGLIRRVRFDSVKTPSNHMATASVWERVP